MVKVAPVKVDLRRGFDHIGISSAFVVHDGNGRILLQKRGLKARDEQGIWDTGGGAIEFGETIEDALVREINEELLTKPIEVEFLTLYDVHRVFDGQPSHWITIIHTVKVDPKKVRIGEPHKIEEIGWFTSDNLPSPLHSQFHKSYDIALKKGILK